MSKRLVKITGIKIRHSKKVAGEPKEIIRYSKKLEQPIITHFDEIDLERKKLAKEYKVPVGAMFVNWNHLDFKPPLPKDCVGCKYNGQQYRRKECEYYSKHEYINREVHPK